MSWNLSQEQIQEIQYKPVFQAPLPEITERIKEAVDIQHMSKTLFVIVGAGGSQSVCENIGSYGCPTLWP